MDRICIAPGCYGYLKQPNPKQKYCSHFCAKRWGRSQGSEAADGPFLRGLQLVQRPGCFSFKWVCHCGAEWSRAPETKAPCRHADMQRIAVNHRQYAKAGDKKDPYPTVRKYVDEAICPRLRIQGGGPAGGE